MLTALSTTTWVITKHKQHIPPSAINDLFPGPSSETVAFWWDIIFSSVDPVRPVELYWNFVPIVRVIYFDPVPQFIVNIEKTKTPSLSQREQIE